MSSSTLSTIPGSGTQASTQSPQASSASSSTLNGQAAPSVQPGTATSLLESSTAKGIQLQNLPVPAVSLSASTVASPTTTGKHHTINPVLLGFSIVLFVVAIVLFVGANRTAKTTTPKTIR